MVVSPLPVLLKSGICTPGLRRVQGRPAHCEPGCLVIVSIFAKPEGCVSSGTNQYTRDFRTMFFGFVILKFRILPCIILSPSYCTRKFVEIEEYLHGESLCCHSSGYIAKPDKSWPQSFPQRMLDSHAWDFSSKICLKSRRSMHGSFPTLSLAIG